MSPLKAKLSTKSKLKLLTSINRPVSACFAIMIRMKITHRSEAVHISKPESVEVDYYLFNDYEVHYNEQLPHTSQQWHHHEKIWETLFIISGEMTLYWREGDVEQSAVVREGDVVETERTVHTFINESDQTVRFIVIKRIPSTGDYRELFKSDKIIDG